MKAPKTFYSAHQPKQWNPDTLIELTSCFGTTLKGNRCRNPIAKAKVAYARAILNELAIINPWTASTSPRLLNAVSIMLCYHHTNQVAEVADQWKAQILNCTYATYTKGYDKYGYFNAQQRSHFNTQQGSHFSAQRGNYFSTQQGSQFNTQQESSFNTQQENQFNTQQESSFNTQQEDPPHQQPNREQRGQEEEEKRRMHEHAQKEGRPKGEEEKQQREGERQERENREPTRMQAREKDTATQDHAHAWRRYYAGWEAVEESKDKVGLDRIPWPTESGKWEDVTEKNVRAFFENAAPVHMPGEERFRILSRENKRWHTDKIISRFGQETLKAPCGNALNTIAKLMVELRREAKMRRKG